MPSDGSALLRAREIVLSEGWNTTSFQILTPGFRLWFSKAGDAVVGWIGRRGGRVVAGAPICAHERLVDVVAEAAHRRSPAHAASRARHALSSPGRSVDRRRRITAFESEDRGLTPRSEAHRSIFRAQFCARKSARGRNELAVREVLEVLRARRVSQLAERLRLDLPDALARDLRSAGRPLRACSRTSRRCRSACRRICSSRGVRVASTLRVCSSSESVHRGVGRRDALPVLDEVAERALLVVADRRLERDRLLHDLAAPCGPCRAASPSCAAISSGVGSRPSCCTR